MGRSVDLSAPDAAIWETHNLNDHLALLQRQVRRSLDDPETHRLALTVAQGQSDRVTAWGRSHRMTKKTSRSNDPCCDIAQVWNFGVLNVAYVKDPDEYDLFCTVKHTLAAGVGDCDDSTILQGALLKALGFSDVRARVISVDGRRWAHVYTMVNDRKDGDGRLIALDPTVRNATPGWEFAEAKARRDFKL